MASDDSELLSFADAIRHQRTRGGEPAVLLGNGFSIDWNKQVFHYDSLFDEADLNNLSAGKTDLFEALRTRNFEAAVNYLNAAAALAELYRPDEPDLVEELRSDALVVKRGLADVLAKRHPKRPAEVSDSEAEHARAFLQHFRRIYTVNYDLLLYWVINRTGVKYGRRRCDAFNWPTAEPSDVLIWKPKIAKDSQDVSYLHGGFHLFPEMIDGENQLRKLSYTNTPLLDVVKERLNDGRYPLVVTEGSSEEKQARISGSPYLRYCLDDFRSLEGDLFVHGLSMASNDDHLFGAIAEAESGINRLYVGVHGPATKDSAQELMDQAKRLAKRRKNNKGAPLSLRFYDTKSAHVWRGGVVEI